MLNILSESKCHELKFSLKIAFMLLTIILKWQAPNANIFLVIRKKRDRARGSLVRECGPWSANHTNSTKCADNLAVFILEDALSVWTNLGKHLLLDGLCVSSTKTGTRCIMRLDELSSVGRLGRRTSEDSSSRRIMRLVPVFILETHNPSNNKCLPKFVQTDNASSSIKTAKYDEYFNNILILFILCYP